MTLESSVEISEMKFLMKCWLLLSEGIHHSAEQRYRPIYYCLVILIQVIRDKRTSKTKGYGFVSFVRSEDYIRAMKEMNDQYIGNRPVKLTRSKWKERTLEENKDEIKDASFKKVKTN